MTTYKEIYLDYLIKLYNKKNIILNEKIKLYNYNKELYTQKINEITILLDELEKRERDITRNEKLIEEKIKIINDK